MCTAVKSADCGIMWGYPSVAFMEGGCSFQQQVFLVCHMDQLGIKHAQGLKSRDSIGYAAIVVITALLFTDSVTKRHWLCMLARLGMLQAGYVTAPGLLDVGITGITVYVCAMLLGKVSSVGSS